MMKKLRLIAICTFSLLVFSNAVEAAVTVTPAPNGTCLNVSPGAYIAIGNIVITEGINSDFGFGQGAGTYTFVLTAPANFQFNPGVGAVAEADGDLSAPTITVTATTISVTVTYDGAPSGGAGSITISLVQARATAAASTGQILRTGGTLVVTGDAAGGGVNHGNLTSAGATYTSNAAGNWNASATWVGGIPPACATDNVVINHAVTGNVTTTINNLTINTGGNLTSNNAITVNGTFAINGTGTYSHNNATAASTTIFNGTESFATTSNIVVTNWSSSAVPLATGVTGNFGNITFSLGGVWDQDGLFSPNRIKGNVLITSGQINFDDGTGGTTVLTIDGSVTTSGASGIIFAQGANRNLTLTTGAFTHNGTSLVACMYQTHGNLIWTINGDATFNDDFTAIQGSITPAASSSNLNITGNFVIGAISLFDVNRGLAGTTSPVTVTVGGASTWNCTSGTGWIRFLDGGSGAVTFTTSSLTSSGTGLVNIKMDGTALAIGGNVTLNCTNNFAISNSNDFYLLGGNLLTTGNGTNNVNLTVGGTFSMNSNAGNVFYGIDLIGTSSAGVVTANFGAVDFQGGTFILHNGNHTGGGLNTVNVTNTFNINFTNATDQVILINNISSGAGPTYNNIRQNITVGGNLTLSGNATTASFRGSASTGVQNVNITGDFNMGGGAASRFTSGALGHALTVNVGGNLNATAGEFWYSYRPGTVTASVTANMAVSGGSLAIKGDVGASTFTVNGNYTQTGGIFSLYHDDAKAINMTNNIDARINGTFSLTAGVLNYDNRSGSTGTHGISLFGSSYTFGGTGIINRGAASPFTSITSAITVFGEFYFARGGTTTYINSAAPGAGHFLQGVKQFVNTGTTVDATGSTQPFLIASNSTANNIAGTNAKWALNVDGVLDMGTRLISSFPSITAYFSGIKVNAGSRLRTANTFGFYDGTTSACLQPQVFSGNTSYRMDFNLDATSTIEYYASANQTVTGKFPNTTVAGDVALATAAQYHYGYLDINNQGTLGTNFASPTSTVTGNVFVRTSLVLTRGELNLAGSGTGQTITLENGAATGITRDGVTTNGYVKSEEVNGGLNRAKIAWNMGTNTGAHIYPFGVTTGTANYVPFTFDKTTAGAANITVSTRASAANDNLPWAGVSSVASVTVMSSPAGGYTNACVPSVIDRWWDITAAGTVTANLTFSYRGAENTTTLSPTGSFGAQHWNGGGWDAIVGSAAGVTSGVGAVTVTGQSTFSPWVLASLSAVLPIELVKFESTCENKNAVISWATASETNNDYFTLEKSPDGVTFSELAKIKSKSIDGNSTSLIEYSYSDYNAKSSYYRLSQTDLNTKMEVFKMIYNSDCSNTDPMIGIYSFDKNIILDINSESDKNYSIELVNSIGQNVLTKELLIRSGANELKIDCDFLSNGIYYINILEGSNQKIAKKIILSK